MSMLKELLLNRTQLPTISSGLDAYSLRQKVIANNVTNAETDGYEAKEVKFEETFREALKRQKNGALATDNENHIPSDFNPLNVKANMIKDKSDFFNGMNNVNIDTEMAELAKTQIKYDAMTKLAKKQFQLIKSAIRGQG